MSETKDIAGPEAQDDPFVLEAFIPFKLAVLSETVSKLIARDYSDRFGITISEWRVLALVGQYDEVRAQTVVEKTPMDKVAVSRAVSALVQKGLLEKRKSPTDKRSALLHLSKRGEAITRDIQQAALSHDREVLSVLDAHERAALSDLLDRLIIRAKDLSRE